MAGIDLANTRMGVIAPAGVHIQTGEYTNAGDGTVFVPTEFQTTVWGVCVGDLTDTCAGFANSICQGPTIRFSMTDSTGMTGITYIAFGY
jgi:hypothetical protein